MQPTEIDNRESKLLAFVDAKNNLTQRANDIASFNNDPEIKLRKLNKAADEGKSVAIDTILGRVYKDALPYNDPKKNCSDYDAGVEIKNFISDRTDGKNSEWYVKEAIKKNNSHTLKSILAEATSASKRFYAEKAADIGQISIEDLNFNPNKDMDDMDRISKKMELDEISSIIQNNVQKAIQAEKEKISREDEYNKKIEDALAGDTSVTDDASMEAAIEKHNMFMNMPRVHRPSLFEAIMTNKCNTVVEHTNDGSDVMNEAVREYTKLSMIKALKLESFNRDDVIKLANKYVYNK